ncbi:alpha/beta fold hydrolase [Actinoplanes friuliensis]|uniref:Alpha/beta hydrolase fold protein n=1 Tax=Actinoplanes friuliensis DSM 7358 TaxID=1246995 RepID=U5VND2_9ACTN|nr:alpha/beta hydrolase [Actinoplanes friuliensis]AGZ38478.1 alpha/beta hydrolase fold protein [Actinoplanes friuliensis DSM 7358]
MPTISTSDGVNLHYTDEGSGRPVVLIAGFTAPTESWELQRLALLATGYRVLALDRRSHGLSDNPAYGQRMSRHGKDVRDFLDAAGLDDVVLIGGSMGASTIWAYYDLFGADRVRGIVSVDQTPKMVNDEVWKNGFYGLDRHNLGTFFEDGVPDTGRGLSVTESMRRIGRLIETLGRVPQMSDARAPETWPLLQDHAEQDWRDVVARVSVPSLFIAGADSQLWPSEHATDAAATNSRAASLVLDDCGHAANIDQPDLVNEAIVKFLAGLP